jgi:UDP-2-acetamido-3-amino-2,3-dideoxy-glucuronate N-acetyltransferase
MDQYIDPTATIGEGTTIGRYAVIGARVKIGRGSSVGHNTVIHDGTVIGDRVRIDDNTVVGKLPMKASISATTGGGAVSPAVIGDDCLIGASVENHCSIGRYCKLESEAYITAYSELGDRVFIAPQVSTSNDNYIGRTEERFKHFKGITVEKGGRVGVGAVIMPGKRVGADAVVAGGSVLTRNAPPRKIVLGWPARPIKDVPEEQLLENQGWEDE